MSGASAVSKLKQVSAASPVPMYRQIELIVRNEIMSGDYRPGETLPSEAELSRMYDVSRITAKQALSELAAAGLVTRFRGRGTVVNDVPRLPPLRASVSKWLDTALLMGAQTQVRLIEVTEGAANFDEAEALKVPPDTPVQRALRVRHQNDAPISLLHTVLPGDLAPLVRPEDMADQPLLSLIAKAGRTVDRAEQTITATLANQSTAALLDYEAGAALIKIQRIVYDDEGVPLEYLTALYRPDRYQLEMVLSSENKMQRVGALSDGILQV